MELYWGLQINTNIAERSFLLTCYRNGAHFYHSDCLDLRVFGLSPWSTGNRKNERTCSVVEKSYEIRATCVLIFRIHQISDTSCSWGGEQKLLVEPDI
jgi:hypothetical protein